MKNHILAFLLVMITFFGSSGETPKFATPDFAYPQTVITTAKKNLDAGLDPLRCLLEIATAERSIDPDTVFTLPAMVDKYVAKANTDARRAMIIAFEAEIYTSIYQDSRWKYNKVDAPLTPLPDDISKWSAMQFAYKLKSLYADALALAAADNSPLAQFEDCLELDKTATEYIPDIYSFILLRKIYSLNSFHNDEIVGRDSLAAWCGAAAARYPAGSAPAIYWRCRAIDYSVIDGEYDAYLALYKDNIGKPGAPYALLKAIDYDELNGIEEEEDGAVNNERVIRRDHLIATLRDAIRLYPDFYAKAQFGNRLKELTVPSVKYTMPSMVAPGSRVDIAVSYEFTKSVGFGLYRMPLDGKSYTGYKISQTMPCLDRKSVETGDTYGRDTISFDIVEPGVYAVVPMIDGEVRKNAMSTQIVCAPFIPVVVNGCTTNAFIAADYSTGAPLSGVQADYMQRGRGNSYSKKYLGKTGKSGILAFTTPKSNGYWGDHLQFTYANRVYKFNNSVSSEIFTERPLSVSYHANILTDRNIYHPGDTVSWAVTVAKMAPGDRPAVCAGCRVVVEFYGANGKKLDSVKLTADELGRASGSFATEKEQLTGDYFIKVFGDGRDQYGARSVMVSDFKMPTFDAVFTAVERDVPGAGAVRLTGKARTYSGMPVAGAKVNVEIRGAVRRLWFMSAGKNLASLEATTGDDGVFTVDVPAAILDVTDYEGRKYHAFEAVATVTSATAETASCMRNFITGKPYELDARVAASADGSKPLPVRFEAYNADGENKPVAMTWQLLDTAGKTVLSGGAKGGETVDIDVSALPAQKYTVSLAPADTALAEANPTAADVVIYNVKRNLVPEGEMLFVPETSYTVTGSRTEIVVGTSHRQIYAYAAMRLGNDLVTFEPRKISRGFSSLRFDLPETLDDATVYIFTVVDGRQYVSEVTLKRPAPAKTKIVAESFRDRLVPGAGETWRFRLVDGNGNGLPDAAFVATMYNKALDRLESGDFSSAFAFYVPSANIWLDSFTSHNLSGSNNLPFTLDRVKSISWPVYLFWDGQSYFNTLKVRGVNSYKSAAMGSIAVKEELAVSDEAESEDAAPLQSATAGAAYVEADAEADGGAPVEPAFEYRLSEVLQAFWRPALTTDADGNVDIVFTVPDANTTWQFKATAWSKDLMSASMAAEVLANKPVMVQPNLPRFMRQGDTATILATVYNNSADTADVTSTVEIFDVATGAVIASRDFSDTIAPDASAVVAMPVEASVDAAAIGYRVRAVAGSFADGEQAAIPVLSASSTVIESSEFYLNPGQKEPFTLTVNASPDASVTLQYCQNPVWTVVKAMRGIAGRNETSSVGIVGRLFSALAAKHIVTGNPAIADAIRQWKDNPSEEALVSMLSKNEDLKRLMLDQTPWLQAANSNSQRMAMLADFLDPVKADQAVKTSAAALAKMQNSDGGFQWGSWSRESSEWATRTVLTTLGLANSLGMIPADAATITGMIAPAYAYVEKAATQPRRAKTDDELALIASLFPSVRKTVDGDRLVRNTVARIARDWRTDDNVAKAYDVIILAANARKVEAAKVLASIRQFGVVKPGMGLAFPSVNDMRAYATFIQAYKVMDAPDSEIDAMRQWVIVQAQASDNIGAYNPDYIIAAVLLTGSDWTSVPVAENVTVNGKPLAIGSVESSTGYFAQRIAGEGRLVISVAPNGVTPSYGSVVTVDRRPMETVKARPGRDLEIEKRVLVQRDGQWVETGDFALGERVRVQLTIVAKRNLQYVSIDDERPACFEPVDQLPGYVYGGGLGFYRENLDASTRMFVSYLPQGTYHVTYDMTAALAGRFISGIATLQSQYAPELTAHSAAARITVK